MIYPKLRLQKGCFLSPTHLLTEWRERFGHDVACTLGMNFVDAVVGGRPRPCGILAARWWVCSSSLCSLPASPLSAAHPIFSLMSSPAPLLLLLLLFVACLTRARSQLIFFSLLYLSMAGMAQASSDKPVLSFPSMYRALALC